jgi:hypothetical protein
VYAYRGDSEGLEAVAALDTEGGGGPWGLLAVHASPHLARAFVVLEVRSDTPAHRHHSRP